MKENPLRKLQAFGQSIWLELHTVRSDRQRRAPPLLFRVDGLRGMTSNPFIFEQVIAGSHGYDEDILAKALKGQDAIINYEAFVLSDMESASDEFQLVYNKTDGKNEYVSLEANPHLAHDTTSPIEEARRLWYALNRPSVFIKVPATTEGLPAIQQLIGEGINVNVTLLFDLPRYRQVAEACITGIKARVAQGKSVQQVVSVTSFLVSRIDGLAHPLVEKFMVQNSQEVELAQQARGQVAIARAKMGYRIYQQTFGSNRFRRLAVQGARVQRLLWASTGTENPDYSDVKYIEALIGADTVSTVPVETLAAFRDHGDHGDPQARIEEDVEQAERLLTRLSELGISLDEVTQQLEDEGVEKFSKPFDKLMETLPKRARERGVIS